MKAVEISRPGGPEVLALTDRPVPEPELDQVVIRVAYAGVNRPDALQRAGLYNPPKGASDLALPPSGVRDRDLSCCEENALRQRSKRSQEKDKSAHVLDRSVFVGIVAQGTNHCVIKSYILVRDLLRCGWVGF